MKKILPILSIVFIMAACSNGDKNAVVPVSQTPAPDTFGLAQFKNWKAQNELTDLEEYNTEEYPVAPQSQARKSSPAVRRSVSSSRKTSNSNSGSVNRGSSSNQGTVMNSESSGAAKATKKKRFSKAAKGAVIGGVGGAVVGGVINKKNRVVGAVVGAVIGAGGGYVIGRKMDKKDGRYLNPGVIPATSGATPEFVSN